MAVGVINKNFQTLLAHVMLKKTGSCLVDLAEARTAKLSNMGSEPLVVCLSITKVRFYPQKSKNLPEI